MLQLGATLCSVNIVFKKINRKLTFFNNINKDQFMKKSQKFVHPKMMSK